MRFDSVIRHRLLGNTIQFAIILPPPRRVGVLKTANISDCEKLEVRSVACEGSGVIKDFLVLFIQFVVREMGIALRDGDIGVAS